jgi:type IV pilus assembly protein PilE
MVRAMHRGMARVARDGRGQSGFTLLELVVVVTIVAILASLAIASYEFAIRKSRRSAAQGCVAEAAQFMERFYTTNLNYAQDLAGNAAVLPRCTAEVAGSYAVSFAAGQPTATTFVIQAVPQGRQARDSCGTMSMNQTGRRLPDGDCW